MRDLLSDATKNILTINSIHRALKARPNAAHIALASLSIPNVLKQIAPQAESYHLITQNVDGLSASAHKALFDRLTSEQQGTSDVPEKTMHDLPPSSPTYIIEMHGRIHDVICTVCDARVANFDSPLCPALGEADKGLDDVTIAGSRPSDIPIGDLPKCTNCGALARPGVVWFGEEPLYLDEIDEHVASADMCLVVGTSSTVRFMDASLIRNLIFHRFIQQRVMPAKSKPEVVLSPFLIWREAGVIATQIFSSSALVRLNSLVF